MNIIIADDERLVRSSLRSMLDELDMPIRIVGEAVNGEELLEALRNTSPNLIFVDIRMPKLNGLEAIRQGKEIAPDVSWVILTGFSEFIYAQEAIRLGASNYLLKPADPEELEKCVQKAMDQQNKAAYYLNYEFEHWIATQLHRTQSNDSIEERGPYESYCFAGMTMYCDSIEPKNDTSDRLYRLIEDVQQTCLRQAGLREIRSGIVMLHNEGLSSFWAWPAMDPRKDEELLFSIQREAASMISRSPELSRSVTLLRTGVSAHVHDLLRQMDELQALAPLRIFSSSGQILSLGDLKAEADNTGGLAMASDLMQLISLFYDKNYVGYLKKLSAMKKQQILPLFGNRNALRNVCHFLQKTMLSSVDADMQPDEWFRSLENQGDALLESTEGSAAGISTDLVQRIIQYIDAHYMEDIAIGTIAGEFNMTPNYLSTLFHKRQGVTFVKYLTNIRMMKAKELLFTRSELKIQEVAQMVGYFSPRHFTKLFIEHYGCYPSDIRSKLV